MKISFLITLISLSVLNVCHKQTISILGYWENIEDKNNCIIIENELIYQLYNNDTISINKYQTTNVSCDTNYISNKVTNLEFISIHDGTCYEITSISDTLLAYRHTISGKLQIFHKKH